MIDPATSYPLIGGQHHKAITPHPIMPRSSERRLSVGCASSQSLSEGRQCRGLLTWGGVTLGPDQGEPGAEIPRLGRWTKWGGMGT